jgi:hypothetical protein
VMTARKIWICCLLCGSGLLFPVSQISAKSNANGSAKTRESSTFKAQQEKPNAATPAAQAAGTEHDGRRDFDFEAGTWNIHLKRLAHPLTGSNTWVEFDGQSVTRKIWDGAEIEQFETNSPAAGHIEGLTLRLYNPESHQWRLYWANSKTGILDPPNVGEFRNGRGEFLCQDTFNGKTILVRMVWSDITPTSAHSEQSFSTDGGKTWEVNWITDQTRVSDEANELPAQQNLEAVKTSAPPNSPKRDGQHDFEPLLGDWKYHLKRRMNPLTGSNTWIDLYGTGVCYPLWNRRAALDTIEVDGPTGHIEGLTLRIYNPESHEWRLYWANSRIGVMDPPQVGKFTDGRGEFYAQDTVNGKTILIRFVWTDTTTDTPHFEQSFSDDGGKTWEVNWITDQTHVKDESGKSN